ncbi:hypothetical protein F5Y14DRAFT_412819 [Nemania sp. NC0429]|nr:hypothetical protein F5Y14DRAFT_412819 [Nemania sp. NC0429]
MASPLPPPLGGHDGNVPSPAERSAQDPKTTSGISRVQGTTPNQEDMPHDNVPSQLPGKPQGGRSKLSLKWRESSPTTSVPTKHKTAAASENTPVANQKTASGTDKVEVSSYEARPHDSTSLVDWSNLVQVPSIDIIAVHDISQSSVEAWAYKLDSSSIGGPLHTSKARSASVDTQERTDILPDPDAPATRLSGEAMKPSVAPTLTRTATPAPTMKLDTTAPEDKGKGIVPGGENSTDASRDRESGYKPPTQHREKPPATDNPSQRQASDDGHKSPRYNLPPPNKEFNIPSEKPEGPGASSWLTDSTMLASHLDNFRVLAFDYEPPQSTQLVSGSPGSRGYQGYEDYLIKTAKALLSRLETARADNPSKPALVFIATGFGCLIIQVLVNLLAYHNNTETLNIVAAIIFFDAPNPMFEGESAGTRQLRHSAKARGLGEAILNSGALDGKGIWGNFHDTIQKREILTGCFNTLIPVTSGATFTLPEGVDFPARQLAPINPNNSRPLPNFSGPEDPNYHSFVDYLKECLVLKASASKDLEGLLTHFINKKYNLNATDYKGRCGLHRAVENNNFSAVNQLSRNQPDLVLKRDRDGQTPLHRAIKNATSNGENLNETRKKEFRSITQVLASKLADFSDKDDLRDNWGNSPWDYARNDSDQWIQDLRPEPTGGAEAKEEGIEDSQPPADGSEEKVACEQSDATLAQFYVSSDNKKDFLDVTPHNVYRVIYDEKYGTENLFRWDLRLSKKMQATCRWAHLPANNEEWVHHLFARQFKRVDKSTSRGRHIGSAPFDRHIFPGAYGPDQNPLSDRTIALFMPVLGFEKNKNRQQLRSVMRGYDQDTGSTSNIDKKNARFIKAYLKNGKFPLHCRRTLDQFTYHMLEDTDDRDKTQVMLDWANRQQSQNKPSEDGFPVLMVDQLWLWVLQKEKTVITSLPDTWEATAKYNFIPYFVKSQLKDNDNRPLVEGPMELANSVIRCSIDFLHRPGPLDVTLYKCFQSRIAEIADDLTTQFKSFKYLVEQLSQGNIDPQERTELTNQLFKLNTEMELLAYIMDIQDELKTISRVFNKQKEVLVQFAKLIENSQFENVGNLSTKTTAHEDPESSRHQEGKTPQSTGYQNFTNQTAVHDLHSTHEPALSPTSKALGQAKENVHLVQLNLQTVREMAGYANKIEHEINSLLSLRHKQINAWEARFASEGSELTQRQSYIILIFTIVTVFFLPLSFMSSVFAIQVDAFPHDLNGEVDWPIGIVLGLLFGVSAGTSLFIILLGFNIAWISRFFTKVTDYFSPSVKTPQPKDEDEAVEPDLMQQKGVNSSSVSTQDSWGVKRPMVHRRKTSTQPQIRDTLPFSVDDTQDSWGVKRPMVRRRKASTQPQITDTLPFSVYDTQDSVVAEWSSDDGREFRPRIMMPAFWGNKPYSNDV